MSAARPYLLHVNDPENKLVASATPAVLVVRDEKGRLLPGSTANPGGRKALSPEVRALLQAHTEDAVRALVSIMTNVELKPADRIRAAEAFLDRALGRAPQAVTVTGQDGNPIQLDVRAGLMALMGKLAGTDETPK